ncbi:adenylate kinase-domain-containing protein [Polychytrium aggregatum]|uniref:adenylate kinase-domain-containing protein n=1 Tax=Polychytrium aggregatum TaxID=110093 RepID=UPI0022FEFDB0|nr:adenylate kinase-domain-containing protein [Polychytrium aggregatum]KAI9203214.1 adenylate kinase-domain-containing protein [Polychytrium aggregatum]
MFLSAATAQLRISVQQTAAATSHSLPGSASSSAVSSPRVLRAALSRTTHTTPTDLLGRPGPVAVQDATVQHSDQPTLAVPVLPPRQRSISAGGVLPRRQGRAPVRMRAETSTPASRTPLHPSSQKQAAINIIVHSNDVHRADQLTAHPPLTSALFSGHLSPSNGRLSPSTIPTHPAATRLDIPKIELDLCAVPGTQMQKMALRKSHSVDFPKSAIVSTGAGLSTPSSPLIDKIKCFAIALEEDIKHVKDVAAKKGGWVSTIAEDITTSAKVVPIPGSALDATAEAAARTPSTASTATPTATPTAATAAPSARISTLDATTPLMTVLESAIPTQLTTADRSGGYDLRRPESQSRVLARGCPAVEYSLSATSLESRQSLPVMQPPRIVYVLGGPGSGKGTHCQRLSKELGFKHISLGDLLRKEVERNTVIGRTVATAMINGTMVSDEIVVEILRRALRTMGGEVVLLDGFPRTADQVQAISKLGFKCVGAVGIEVGQQELEARLLKRGRRDDNCAAVQERIRFWGHEGQSVTEQMSRQILKPTWVNGEGSFEDVYQSVSDVVKRFAGSPDPSVRPEWKVWADKIGAALNSSPAGAGGRV